MNAPAKVPFAVLRSIVKRCQVIGDKLTDWKLTDANARALAAKVKWSSINGCYFYWMGEMYVGIELDGYIHT